MFIKIRNLIFHTTCNIYLEKCCPAFKKTKRKIPLSCDQKLAIYGTLKLMNLECFLSLKERLSVINGTRKH